MRTYVAILFLSALVSFLATPIAKWLAAKLGAVDVPSDRKIHLRPTPRLGGIAVFLGFCLPLTTFYILENRVSAIFRDYETSVAVLLLAGVAMLALGIYDDCRGADARKKFAVQIPAALFLFFVGNFRMETLSNPFGAPIHLGWLALPFSILWIVAITNAINLLDGIDGLVPGVTAVIALCLAIINAMYGNTFIAVLTFCLAGACAGFLPHNFAPAKIFLGDSGSLFVGITLAGISMFSLFKGTTATLIVPPLILFGLPLFDTTSVMIGRFAGRRPLFQADKSHIHHRLLELGLTQRKAALFLYVITALLGAIAISMSVDGGLRGETIQLCAAGLLVVATAWLVWKMRAAREVKCSPSKKPSNVC
jgi:UDP-GlcNAc:undecaprenyl-phosphate GlcNAc-1-phosphate transferase